MDVCALRNSEDETVTAWCSALSLCREAWQVGLSSWRNNQSCLAPPNICYQYESLPVSSMQAFLPFCALCLTSNLLPRELGLFSKLHCFAALTIRPLSYQGPWGCFPGPRVPRGLGGNINQKQGRDSLGTGTLCHSAWQGNQVVRILCAAYLQLNELVLTLWVFFTHFSPQEAVSKTIR